MPFSPEIKERVLVESARWCCVCQRYRGVKVEVHHIDPEAESHDNTYENAICLCFDCHTDAGHYNPKHPKGTKFSPSELKKHRERWKETVRQNKIQLVGEEHNLIHVQFFACMDIDIAKEICAKNLNKFPLKDSILFSNKAFAYQCDLVSKMPLYLWRDFKTYANEAEYLKINPEAVPNPEAFPSFAYSRTIDESKDLKLVQEQDRALFNFYLQGGLQYKDFVSLNASHPSECGGGNNMPIVEETMKINRPFFFYLSITNLHSGSIQLDSIVYDTPIDNEKQTDIFPPLLFEPNKSVIIPLGQFLEHNLDNYDSETFGNDASPERVLLTYKNSYNKAAKYFGASIHPQLIRYKFGNNFFDFIPHEFDLNKVYYIDWAWQIGSCPHCFIKESNSQYSYLGEILPNGQNKSDVSSLFFDRDIKELLITEIEDEITFLDSIELNGNLIMANQVLIKGQSISVFNIKKGDIIRIRGHYEPSGQVSRTTEALYRRNDLVASFLKKLHI